MAKHYTVRDRHGGIVLKGDTILDFRGETAVFVRVSRGPSQSAGRSCKVIVNDNGLERELYQTVYDLTITEHEDKDFLV